MTEPHLVYALDPLCGWCFAFADSAAAVRRAFEGRVEWEVACGGLVVGDRVGPIAQSAAYLRRGMATVETRTRARFGAGFRALLDEGTWISNSEPACRATLLVQTLYDGAVAVDFAGALSRGFYGPGLPPDSPEGLRAAAEASGVDAEELLDVFEVEEAYTMTAEAIARARSARLTSYPALYLRDGDRLRPILPGYAAPEAAVAAVAHALRASP